MTAVSKKFADVTASTFDDVSTVVTQMYFDDVTANLFPVVLGETTRCTPL